MKTKIIASIAVSASLLMSGCAHRAPAHSVVTPAAKVPDPTTIKSAAICQFMAYSKGKTYSGATATLITFNDGNEFVHFANGDNKLVYTKMYSKDGKHLMHMVKDTADDGSLIIGSAYDCR